MRLAQFSVEKLMHLWAAHGLVTVALVTSASAVQPAAFPVPESLDVNAGERLLVIAPHPDDETIGAGGLIQRVLQRDGTVRVVLVTAGDGYVEAVAHETGLPRPRPSQYIAYGERRLQEARAAVREFAGDRVRLQVLGFPDGGLVALLHAHWQRTRAEQSRTTGVSEPPYPEALDPTLAYDGADLLRELLRLVREDHPTLIALPHPADRHPDHHATGLFTLLALHDWSTEAASPDAPRPRLLAYLVHWPDWPPANPDAGMLELPPNFPLHDGTRTALTLSDAELATKRAALARYTSQQEVLGSLLARFVRRTEPFVQLPGTKIREVESLLRHSVETRRPRQSPQGPLAPKRQ